MKGSDKTTTAKHPHQPHKWKTCSRPSFPCVQRWIWNPTRITVCVQSISKHFSWDWDQRDFLHFNIYQDLPVIFHASWSCRFLDWNTNRYSLKRSEWQPKSWGVDFEPLRPLHLDPSQDFDWECWPQNLLYQPPMRLSGMALHVSKSGTMQPRREQKPGLYPARFQWQNFPLVGFDLKSSSRGVPLISRGSNSVTAITDSLQT